MSHLSEKIEFIHRPVTGLSVGGMQDGDNIIIAACFLSNNDQFSRKTSRQIISNRIELALQTPIGSECRYAQKFDLNGKTQRQFMDELRKLIKPDQEENDHVFVNSYMEVIDTLFIDDDEEEFIEVYLGCTAEQKWSVIKNACSSI
jgi:hypothetical protein